jgi:hypothetical protein
MLTTTETRTDLIERIVSAAARPCPQIVEARRARHKTTGKVHSLFGMPLNFRVEVK